MTTTVTVKANHGWPVDVVSIDPKTGDEIEESFTTRVPAGETRDFVCTSTTDLLIHEVQPDEVTGSTDQAAEKTEPDAA